MPKALFWRLCTYAAAVVGLLIGPGLLAMLIVVDEYAWPALVGSIALTVLVGGRGVVEAVSSTPRTTSSAS